MPDQTPQSLLSRHLMAIAQHIEELSSRVAKIERESSGQEEKVQRYLDRFLEQVDNAVRDLEQASTETAKRMSDLEGKLSGLQASIAHFATLDEKMGLLNVKMDEDLAGVRKEVELLKKWVDNEFKLDESLLKRLETFPKEMPRYPEPKPTSQVK